MQASIRAQRSDKGYIDEHETGQDPLEALVSDALQALVNAQQSDGHWVFELEADATIPSEYILLNHFLGAVDARLEARLADYIRTLQSTVNGGWPLFHDGDFDMSASVKAYFALKIVGDDIDAPHMIRAREAILRHGGAAKANVFTRITLALFGQVPWRAVPVMPVEVMLLPRWFPFHMSKVSYWSRTVIAPLLILMAHKPKAENPTGTGIAELFVTPAERERAWLVNPTGSRLGDLFINIDKALRVVEPHMPRGPRQRAIDRAVAFITERLNGDDGLGAIFPAMAFTVMAFRCLGYPEDHPDFVTARRAVDKLLYDRGDDSYCQACLSPIWDTGLAAHAVMEAGLPGTDPAVRKPLDWLVERQITEVKGDWALRAPNVRPGGWAFQYANDHYPDVDDTAVVVMALHRADPDRYRDAIDRGTEWILGMQSKNGGWGAFDVDNTHSYLNHIPFADHGALLDPPTVDVSARCLSMLAQLGYAHGDPVVQRGLAYMRKEQETDGSWYGRWGANYIYGTWSALCAFNACGEDMQAPHIRKAVDWLKSRQRADGGWGEDCASYWAERRDEVKESTPSQTAWAVLGLMAAGDADCDAVHRGIAYLQAQPRDGARWQEKHHTGTGFPRVFYLKYHGYSAYFPLWAIARYQTLMRKNDRSVAYGM